MDHPWGVNGGDRVLRSTKLLMRAGMVQKSLPAKMDA